MVVPTRTSPNLCRNVHLSNHTLLTGEGGWGWNFPLQPQIPGLSLKFHLGLVLERFKVVENTQDVEKLLQEGTSNPSGKTRIVQLHREEKKKDKIPVPWKKNNPKNYSTHLGETSSPTAGP